MAGRLMVAQQEPPADERAAIEERMREAREAKRASLVLPPSKPPVGRRLVDDPIPEPEAMVRLIGPPLRDSRPRMLADDPLPVPAVTPSSGPCPDCGHDRGLRSRCFRCRPRANSPRLQPPAPQPVPSPPSPKLPTVVGSYAPPTALAAVRAELDALAAALASLESLRPESLAWLLSRLGS
jgi:hypothetical protein